MPFPMNIQVSHVEKKNMCMWTLAHLHYETLDVCCHLPVVYIKEHQVRKARFEPLCQQQ